MKLKILAIALLVALVGLAGCNNAKNDNLPQPNPEGYGTVTSSDDFLRLHKAWTQRLEDLAGRTDQVYQEWTGGKINTEDFLTKVQGLYGEMKQLNRETDLKTEFKLSDSDKQKVNFDAIDKAYQRASKHLNDFLYTAPRYRDEDIKAKYDEMIKNNYHNQVAELKNLLNMK